MGALLGLLGIGWLNTTMDFIATVYTRLFQLLAVPTIVLAVITTFATFGSQGSGRIFGRTLTYTLLTTFAAAAVGVQAYMYVLAGVFTVGIPLIRSYDIARASRFDVNFSKLPLKIGSHLQWKVKGLIIPKDISFRPLLWITCGRSQKISEFFVKNRISPPVVSVRTINGPHFRKTWNFILFQGYPMGGVKKSQNSSFKTGFSLH